MPTFFQRLQAHHPAADQSHGLYHCAGCNLPLFSTRACFARGNDWASFHSPITTENIDAHTNEIEGLHRHELSCAGCHLHLGYQFDDGPLPYRRRLSVLLKALNFNPRRTTTKD